MGVAEWGGEVKGVFVRIDNPGSWFNSKDIGRLAQALDVRAKGQVAINENIANATNEAHVARHVKFRESMENAALESRTRLRARGRRLQRPQQEPQVEWETTGKVQLADEMSRLAANRGGYTKTAAVLQARLKMLLSAVSDGRSS